MTRQFNLLPAAYAERVAERRWARLTAALLVLLVGVLLLAGWHQGRVLRQAKEARDAEQVRTNALSQRRGQLVRFRQLADAIVARERLLTAAMGSEVAWAAVLSSLSATFPPDASLTSLSVETRLPAFGGPPLKPGDERSVIGTAALRGYSVRQFTPGVDRLLQLLVTVMGLAEPRLQVGTSEEIAKQGVTTFQGTAFLDAAALTGRYARGLPGERDVEVPVGAGAGSAPSSGASSSPAGGGTSG